MKGIQEQSAQVCVSYLFGEIFHHAEGNLGGRRVYLDKTLWLSLYLLLYGEIAIEIFRFTPSFWVRITEDFKGVAMYEDSEAFVQQFRYFFQQRVVHARGQLFCLSGKISA